MIICLQRDHIYAEWKGEKENYTLGYNMDFPTFFHNLRLCESNFSIKISKNKNENRIIKCYIIYINHC